MKSISGCFSCILILLINHLASNVFAYVKPYQCEENYYLFHKWYMEQSRIILLKNELIESQLNKNQEINDQLSKNQEINDQLNVDVNQEDFASFCKFYNDKAEQNETYSPCTDERYDVLACFRRFIMSLNENINIVIEKYFQFGNSRYVLDEMAQSTICNHTLDEKKYSIKDYYEASCYSCLKGLSDSNKCSSFGNTIAGKCCSIAKLMNDSLIKLNGQLINIIDDPNSNKTEIARVEKNLGPYRPICSGKQSPENCECPKGYIKSSESDCIDLNECDENISFCTHLDNELNRKYNTSNQNIRKSICVNTFGKFTCIRIDCPINYEYRNEKCYYKDRLYSKLPIDEKFNTPKIIAFAFISLPRNVHLPETKLELFRIDNEFETADYVYKIHKINSIRRDVNKMSLPYVLTKDINKNEAELTSYFSLRYNEQKKQAIIYLNNEIKSNTEVQIILYATWHSNDKKTFGLSHIILNVYVTN